MPIGTGLGSSGASSVAATKAILQLLGIEDKLKRETVLDYLVAGERATSDQFYPDNVAPSYYGGFNIISRNGLRRVDIKDFHTLVLLQSSLETKSQRRLIDEHFVNIFNLDISDEEKVNFILTLSRFQAREASTLINALRDGDITTAGRVISQIPENIPKEERPDYEVEEVGAEGARAAVLSKSIDYNGFRISSDPGNFVEHVRARTINGYAEIKSILLAEGAAGAAISGSGPAIFAIAADAKAALSIKDRVLDRLARKNITGVKWLVSNVNQVGAELIEGTAENYAKRYHSFHNFWEA
jgi:homoserine kinase